MSWTFSPSKHPTGLTTPILFDQLRGSWGASIHYDRLLEAVIALDSHSISPNWGNPNWCWKQRSLLHVTDLWLRHRLRSWWRR